MDTRNFGATDIKGSAVVFGCGFGFAMTYYITPSIFALGYGEDSATVMSVLNGAGNTRRRICTRPPR